MHLKSNKEIIGGSVFFICAATYYVMAFGIQQYQDGILSSDFIPKVYGIILMILSALQILLGVWQHKKNPGPAETQTRNEFLVQIKAVLLTFVLLICYVVLLEPVGFVIMSSLFIFFMTLLLYPKNEDKENKIKRYVKIAVIGTAFSTVTYLLFTVCFALTLPAGIFY